MIIPFQFKTCVSPKYYLVASLLLLGTVLGCGAADSPSETASPAEPRSTKEKKIGVLLVSHGSRSQGWRNMVSDIGNVVKKDLLQDGRIQGIRSAFMEYSEPSIATQLKTFDDEGYTDLIVVPLLLTVSSHSFDDIPTICGQKQDHKTSETLRLEGIEIYKPRANIHITPLLDYPAVLKRNVTRRVKRMSKEPSKEGIVLVAYGSKPYEKAWIELIRKVSDHVEKETGIDGIERAWCGHIVHYKSGPTEKAIRTVLRQKERVLVVPLLVAVDEMFQGRIIGGAIENVGEKDRIAYQHDSILPDDSINRWVVDIARETAAKLTDPSEASRTEKGIGATKP